jgi:transcriptional regulator with XRE-family HTH domain
MPFNVGMAICRILNLNPRWVVEGKGISAPFVALSDLKLSEDEVLIRSQGMGFEHGYELLLKHPLRLWAQTHSNEEIIHALVQGNPDEPWPRSLSVRDLEELRRDCLAKATSERNQIMAKTYRNQAKMAEEELALRRAGNTRSYTKRAEKPESANKPLQEYTAMVYKVSNMKGSLLSHWIDRANALVSHRGGKAALARDLGVSPQTIHAFLTGASAPSAENTLRLQAWVIETEAKKESSESVRAPSEPKTQTRKSDNENTRSSHEAG